MTVNYTRPNGPDFIRDTRGCRADSFNGQSVTNNSAPALLTASAHRVPTSHDGSAAFTVELRLSEELPLKRPILVRSSYLQSTCKTTEQRE